MINQFHDKVEELAKEIDAINEKYGKDITEYPEDVRKRTYQLTKEYVNLATELWPKIDDFLEYDVKFIIENPTN